MSYTNAFTGSDRNPHACFEEIPPPLRYELEIRSYLSFFDSNGNRVPSHGLSCYCGWIRIKDIWRLQNIELGSCFYKCIMKTKGDECNGRNSSKIVSVLTSCCESCDGSAGYLSNLFKASGDQTSQ